MEATLAEDLGADSLDAVELNMAIEESCGVAIPDEELGNMKDPSATSSTTCRLTLNKFPAPLARLFFGGPLVAKRGRVVSRRPAADARRGMPCAAPGQT